MTDVLQDRCTPLAEPVVALMQRVIESQGNAKVLPPVVSLIGPVPLARPRDRPASTTLTT
ncbi:hypothetical protein E3O25_15140 [Cryobacterium sp. TMT1-3]|uniref:Uncharacterized protein n=1 Tax=Cryobacterium luteum TaxID=1424661 RepID=A0A1H8ADJ6_9MICO|nr:MULTISPECIES: hypothetical protein [Cryobacterium]TFB88481.1 hypothetical protein E3O10_11790 [Cryobacterium luteum]TFC24507.1 hypothetical protein E3O25_15140 [Cryobacterium sp. TMT1-3]SEM68661.1 hypothetical protein SAMN05216281_101138 [Cryobacterium luteum]